MTDSALKGASENETGLPDWQSFALAHDWRRAQATLTLGHADPLLVGTVTSLRALQEDIRAKRYPAARRALDAYVRQLDELRPHLPTEAAQLTGLAPAPALQEALDALQTSSKLADPVALALALAPAEAQPLTRAEAHNARGVVEALQAQPGAAQAHFELALNHDPEHYRARVNLGNLALEEGNPAAAEAHYREALKVNPDYDGAYHNLGVALRRQGKLAQSVQAIRRGQRLGTQRTRSQDKEELEEQLRANPSLRYVRLAAFVVVALIVLAVALGGRH